MKLRKGEYMSIAIIAVLVILGGCGGGGESDDRRPATYEYHEGPEQSPQDVFTDTPDIRTTESEPEPAAEPEPEPDVDTFELHVCSDERAEAVEATKRMPDDIGIPDQYDGLPFIVDVSASFSNADVLMDAVEDEAEKVRDALGYYLFVAGDILLIPDVTQDDMTHQVIYNDPYGEIISPEGHIEVRCCLPEGSGQSGAAAAWWRFVILADSDRESEDFIVHELWHVFGLVHHGEGTSVDMSRHLMYAAILPDGTRQATRSTAQDLAILSCIYEDL